MATNRIAALARTAAVLPEGPTRAGLIALMLREANAKEAGAGLDKHAAIQFVAGLTKKSHDKVEASIKKGDAFDGVLAEHGFENGFNELLRARLWDTVMRASQSALGGMRSMGDEILSMAGAKGVTGEDLASIMGYGGQKMPGMRWDGRSQKYVDRTNARFPRGQSIYYKAGEMFREKKKSGGLRQLKGWLIKKARGLTQNWLQSVDAGKGVKFVTDEDGQLVKDFTGYEDVNPAALLSQQIHLNRIYDVMKRELSSAPGQLVVWDAVVDATNKGKDVLKFKNKGEGKGDLTVQAAALRKHILAMLEKSVGDLDEVDERTGKPYKDSVPSPQALQKNFNKILPKMIDAMERELEGGDLGSMGSAMQRDLDIAEVYEDAIRRRAAKTITASERSAMIRLAASLPVGSPERRAILAGCGKMAGKGKLPDALKKHQFTSKDGDNPPPADADGDGKTNEKKPDFLKEKGKKSARVKSKSESMRMMGDLRKKHGDGTKAYYQAVIDEVKAGVIAPSAVVGGGYKNGKKVAIEWLEGQMKGKKAALIRLAAALPVGSDERKTILRMATKGA